MLTKMRIKNFGSFKQETTIDLKKTNYKILSDTNVSNGVLKGGIFVGANASGKTTVIKAMAKLLRLLFKEEQPRFINDFCLFSDDTNMILEYTFEISSSCIQYYIEYDRISDILIEKLYLDGSILIDRIGDTGKSNITENPIFEGLDNDSLLIREIYFNTKFRGYNTLKKWFEFLLNSIYINAYDKTIYMGKKDPITIKPFIEKYGVEPINNFFEKLNFEQRIEYCDECYGNRVAIKSEEQKAIFFKRKGIGEPIPYFLESLGNKTLLNLLPSFFYCVQNDGMLIIDEFSSGLHNKLEELLVKFFMTNSNNSQLFLVSHSTNLLSNSIFRPDQIYITEFKDSGSQIRRASEERPREAQNIEKMYLGGVFGGIPDYNYEEASN